MALSGISYSADCEAHYALGVASRTNPTVATALIDTPTPVVGHELELSAKNSTFGDTMPATESSQISRTSLIYKVNTSNPLKLSEFKRYLGGDIITESKNLAEPDSDPYTVVQYKASQFNQVLIDDTSLEIEGENIGVNIKWFIDKLENFVGRKAIFRCLLGFRDDDQVYIYESTIEGIIVEKRGSKEGFLPYFQPTGASLTLAESLPDEVNPRFYAVQKFKSKLPDKVLPILKKWEGKFQIEEK